jgi:hypothetical protein
MDNFKKLVWSLEERIEKLEREIQGLKGAPVVNESTHYTTNGDEFGVIALDDLDTFRFTHYYNGSFVNTHNYHLTNPSESLMAYKDNQTSDYTIDIRNLQSRSGPDFVEKNGFNCFLYNRGSVQWKEPTPFEKELFNSKVWEVATFQEDKFDSARSSMKVYPKYLFKRQIKIPFKNNYSSVPVVSFHITPIEQELIRDPTKEVIKLADKLEGYITEITTKHVEFTVYINHPYPNVESRLHWRASGPI